MNADAPPLYDSAMGTFSISSFHGEFLVACEYWKISEAKGGECRNFWIGILFYKGRYD